MCDWHGGQLESADFSSQYVFSLLAKTREFQKTQSAKFIKAALLECLVWQTKPFLKLFLVIFNFSFISLVSLKEARVPSRTIRAICNEPPQRNKQSERVSGPLKPGISWNCSCHPSAGTHSASTVLQDRLSHVLKPISGQNGSVFWYMIHSHEDVSMLIKNGNAFMSWLVRSSFLLPPWNIRVSECQKLLKATLRLHSAGHLQLCAHPLSHSLILEKCVAFEAMKGIASLNLDAVSKTAHGLELIRVRAVLQVNSLLKRMRFERLCSSFLVSAAWTLLWGYVRCLRMPWETGTEQCCCFL